ncbi:MAG: DUF4097 family beta strand repeat-containing protein, partial [Candidatus Korarchaeota archaeon]|nr:DUF4097 family beta strand repeat-containing protein [Candidatus Korarchaeota archaeon]
MNRALLSAGRFFLFVGVLVLSLEYLPWWSIPDYGKAAILMGLGLVLLALSYSMRRASAVKRELVKVLVTVLVSLALSIVFMTVSVHAGRALGMKFAEPAPHSNVTLGSFECNGTLVLNVTAVPFNVRVMGGDEDNLTVKMLVPANLIEEIRKSMSLTYWESDSIGEPSQLNIYTEYERPLILLGFPVYKPELRMEILVPKGCEITLAMVESVSGNVEMEVGGLDAGLRTVSGDVIVRGTYASLQVRTTSGDVNLDVRIGHSGDVRTVSGDIVGHVHAWYGAYPSISGVRGFFSDTTSGDIVLDLSKDDNIYFNVTAETMSGDVKYEGIRP